MSASSRCRANRPLPTRQRRQHLLQPARLPRRTTECVRLHLDHALPSSSDCSTCVSWAPSPAIPLQRSACAPNREKHRFASDMGMGLGIRHTPFASHNVDDARSNRCFRMRTRILDIARVERRRELGGDMALCVEDFPLTTSFRPPNEPRVVRGIAARAVEARSPLEKEDVAGQGSQLTTGFCYEKSASK